MKEFEKVQREEIRSIGVTRTSEMGGLWDCVHGSLARLLVVGFMKAKEAVVLENS